MFLPTLTHREQQATPQGSGGEKEAKRPGTEAINNTGITPHRRPARRTQSRCISCHTVTIHVWILLVEINKHNRLA